MIMGRDVPRARRRRKADVLSGKKKWETVVNRNGDNP
jgi:hypothetical protein